MSSILDNEFMVSNYINGDKIRSPKKGISIFDRLGGQYTEENIEDAIEWSFKSLRHIIIPTSDLEDLERQWIEFNSMHKQLRRESDWKSIELFGATNQDRYEKIRSILLQKDIDNEIEGEDIISSDDSHPYSESAVALDYTDSYFSTDALSYSSLEVEKATKWAEENNRVIIIPTRNLEELESLWDAYNSMIKKHRRESDWMSEELFGITNLRHYEYLKNQFLRNDIHKDDEDVYGGFIESSVIRDSAKISKEYLTGAINEVSAASISKKLIEMGIGCLSERNIYDNTLTNNVISDIMDAYDGIVTSSPESLINFGDMPLLSPDEMIDMGVFSSNPENNFYGVEAYTDKLAKDSISMKEWFAMYRAAYDGFYTEFGFYTSKWITAVRESMAKLKSMQILEFNQRNIDSVKQAILELGWNPEVEFTAESRLIARDRFNEAVNARATTSRFIDIRGYNSERMRPLVEVANSVGLKPVFVVLTEGKRLISKAIKFFTKDIYTHASISFDYTLKTMYSYGINDSPNGSRGGFIEESIDKVPDTSRVRVYTFFLKPEQYRLMEEFIEKLKKEISNTNYSYKNLILYLFNVPYNKDLNMMCSQFVDRCLKVAGIDVSNKDSSLISPHDMRDILNNNKHIYTMYEGFAKRYDAEKINNTIRGLIEYAKPIKEMVRHYTPRQYLHEVYNAIGDLDKLQTLRTYVNSVGLNENAKRVLREMVFLGTYAIPYCEESKMTFYHDYAEELIKNYKNLDYSSELEKSKEGLTKALDEDDKPVIKFELCKLWMMLCVIENKVRSKKFRDLDTEEQISSAEYKMRSRIRKTFDEYLAIILESEEDFDFNKYFDQSNFSKVTDKLRGSTMESMTKMLNKYIEKL